MKNPHPAPFPLELAIRFAKLIDGPLADPFAGSGTMGIAAIETGVPYQLNDLSPEYRDMFRKRKAMYTATNELGFMKSLIVSKLPRSKQKGKGVTTYCDILDKITEVLKSASICIRHDVVLQQFI